MRDLSHDGPPRQIRNVLSQIGRAALAETFACQQRPGKPSEANSNVHPGSIRQMVEKYDWNSFAVGVAACDVQLSEQENSRSQELVRLTPACFGDDRNMTFLTLTGTRC